MDPAARVAVLLRWLIGVAAALCASGCHDRNCPAGIAPGETSTIVLDVRDPDGVRAEDGVLPACADVDDLGVGASLDVTVAFPGDDCALPIQSTSAFPSAVMGPTSIGGGVFGSFFITDPLGCSGRWHVWVLGSGEDLVLMRTFVADDVAGCDRFPDADGVRDVCGDRFFAHVAP